MNRRPSIQSAFIAVFVALVFVPGLQQYLHFVPVKPVVESRAKVPLPPGNPVVEMWRANGYYPEYEKHFNDVFGFRDEFIRLRNQIQFSMFHDSNQVIVGSNGWLADKSTLEVEQRTVDAVDDAQLSVLAKRIVHLNEIFRRRGIYFLVIPVPLKNTVYPEHFPAATARRPAITGYEKLRRLLGANHIPFVDAYGLLAERRRSVDVFYRTDLHWNTAGAEPVAAATVKNIARRFHSNVTWRYEDRYSMHPFEGGGENNVLATIWPVTDVEPVEEQPAPCGEIVIRGPYEEFPNQCPGTKLPKTMVFGNSFSLQMMADGLANHFSTLYLVSDLANFSKILTTIKPGSRVVIWQMFELEIGYQMQSDAWWQQVDAQP